MDITAGFVAAGVVLILVPRIPTIGRGASPSQAVFDEQKRRVFIVANRVGVALVICGAVAALIAIAV